MSVIVDISQKIPPGMPVFYEITGRWGLARTIIATWEHYAETATLRTRGKVKELFRHCMVVMSDNGATHVDATSHIDPLGETADQIAIDQLFGPAVLLDVTHLKPCVRDAFPHFGPESSRIISAEEITVPEIEKACAAARVTIAQGNVVIFHTGAWRTRSKPDFAGQIVPVSAPALHWRIDRGARAIGLQDISLAVAPEMGEPHMVMRQRKFWHIENLSRLDRLPPRFAFVAFPVKFQGAAPLRSGWWPCRTGSAPGSVAAWGSSRSSRPSRSRYSRPPLENFNGRWQAKVSARLPHESLLDFQGQSARYVAAYRRRVTARVETAPSRRPFPSCLRLDLDAPPARPGHLPAAHRSAGPRDAARAYLHRRPALATPPGASRGPAAPRPIRFFAPRRRDPANQPHLREIPYRLPQNRWALKE